MVESVCAIVVRAAACNSMQQCAVLCCAGRSLEAANLFLLRSHNFAEPFAIHAAALACPCLVQVRKGNPKNIRGWEDLSEWERGTGREWAILLGLLGLLGLNGRQGRRLVCLAKLHPPYHAYGTHTTPCPIPPAQSVTTWQW